MFQKGELIMSLIGYARVSSESQNLNRQLDALNKQGVEKIFQEKISGKNTDRPALQEMLKFIREDDTVIVLSLDRLSRNYNDIKDIITKIRKAGAKFQSLDLMPNSTGNPLMDTFMQDMMINMLSFVAQNEREKILERQKQGIQSAKKRGVYKGRPKRYTSGNRALQKAVEMYNDRDNNHMTAEEIARLNGVSRSAIYRNKDMFSKAE